MAHGVVEERVERGREEEGRARPEERERDCWEGGQSGLRIVVREEMGRWEGREREMAGNG